MQSKIHELRNQHDSDTDDKVADDYQQIVDKLEKANKQKNNGNEEEMEKTLGNLDLRIFEASGAKEKLKSYLEKYGTREK